MGRATCNMSLEEQPTAAGSLMGTVWYMSPEQVRAKELDARSDLFSLGVVLYEMATATLPFRGENSATVFEAILNRAPVPAVRLNPDLPAPLEHIIDKCLEKDRDLRYQSAADLRTDLQRQKRDAATIPLKAGGSWKSTAPIAAAVVLTLASSYFYFHRTPKLTNKDTIVHAIRFVNKTTDPVFDGTLRQGLWPYNWRNRPFSA